MKCIKEETKKLECYLLVQHLIWISSVTMGYKSISLARFLGKVGRNVEMKAIICDNSLHVHENPSVLVIIVYFASTPLCLLLNNLLCRVLVAHRVLNCNPSQILQVFVALYLLVDILDPLTWLEILRKKSSGDLTRNWKILNSVSIEEIVCSIICNFHVLYFSYLKCLNILASVVDYDYESLQVLRH